MGGSTAPSTITGTPGLQSYLDRNAALRGGLTIANHSLQGTNPALSSNGTDTSEMTRSVWTVAKDVSDLVLFDTGTYLDSTNKYDTAQPNAITITSAIEYPSGTYHRVYWQGQTSVTIQPGSAVYSDPVTISIPGSLTGFTISAASSGSSFTCSGLLLIPSWRQPNAGDQITFTSGVNAGLSAFLTSFNGSTGVIGTGSGLSTPGVGDSFTIQRHFWLRRYISVSAGQKWYYNHQVSNTSVEGIIANGGVDYTTTTQTINGNGRFMDPWAILGRTPNHDLTTVGWVGDSIGNGTGDIGTNGTTAGFLSRAFRNNVGAIPLCRDSYTAQSYATTGNARTRQYAFGHAQYLICEMGTNDVAASRTFSQLAQDLLHIWRSGYYRGIRVIQTTLPPKASSTDGWQTLGNQTLGTNDTVRQQINDWIRALGPVDSKGMPQVAGTAGTSACGYLWNYIEVADLLESSRNSGKWATPTTVGVSAPLGTVGGSTTTLTDSGASWTTNQWLGYVVYIVSGTGAGQVRPIASNTATAITINTLPDGSGGTWTAPDATSVYKIYNGLTTDGTHPTPTGHALAASAVTSMLSQMTPY